MQKPHKRQLKQWIIYSPTGSILNTGIYTTRERAIEEARNLAEENPGCRYFVAELKEYYLAIKPEEKIRYAKRYYTYKSTETTRA